MSDLKSREVAYGEKIGSGGSDAILSGLFRDVLINLHIDFGKFLSLIDRYIVSHGISSNVAELSTARSALRREFMSQTMTWKVFVKALVFLRVEKVTLELSLYRDGNEKSTHETSFDVKYAEKENEEDDKQTNVLSAFLTEIAHDLGIQDKVFKDHMNDYVKFSKPGAEPSEQYTAKCSLRREMHKSSISWKVFVRGLIFFKTSKLIINLTLHHRNDVRTEHRKTIVFK